MNFQKIREDAKQKEQDYLYSKFQLKLNNLWLDLIKNLPNRNITLVWGNATYVLSIENKVKVSKFGLYENFNNNTNKDRYPTSLSNLLLFCEEMHDINERQLCFDSLVWKGLNKR